MQSPESILKSVKAWQTGHFLLSSGLHSNEYMQCQKVLQYPSHGMTLALLLAEKMKSAGIIPDVVVGPALGAVHMEVFTALALNQVMNDIAKTAEIRAVFAEREGGSNEFSIRRGIELVPGEKVLVVEDVTTTGGSAKKVLNLVKELGATPVAVAALIDRSGGKVEFGVPFFNLISLNLETWKEKNCPLCLSGSKPIKPGSTKFGNA